MMLQMKAPSVFSVCLLEFLERLGFYSFLTFFTVHLTTDRGMTVAAASELYGTMMLLLYLLPVLGGAFADRVLGYPRAVALGGFLLLISYLGLAFLPAGAFYPSLAALFLGGGLFRPNVMALLSSGYRHDSSKREAAFLWLFLAINLGAGVAPVMAGLVGQSLPGHGPFVVSAIAMALGVGPVLWLLRSTQRKLADPDANQRERTLSPSAKWPVARILLITLLSQCTAVQVDMVLRLWSRDHVDMTMDGLIPASIGPTVFLALDSVFQLLLAPIVVVFFLRLRKRGIEPSGAAKVGMSMILQILPCLLLFLAARTEVDGKLVQTGWVVAAHLAAALPKLFLLPLVLSIVAQLVPANRLGTLFGVWFPLSGSMTFLAGKVAAWSIALPSQYIFLSGGIFAIIAASLWIAQARTLDLALGAASQRRAN